MLTLGGLLKKPEYTPPADMSELTPFITKNFNSDMNMKAQNAINKFVQDHKDLVPEGFIPDVEFTFENEKLSDFSFPVGNGTVKLSDKTAQLFKGQMPDGVNAKISINAQTLTVDSAEFSMEAKSGNFVISSYSSTDLSNPVFAETGLSVGFDWDAGNNLKSSQELGVEFKINPSTNKMAQTASLANKLTAGSLSKTLELEFSYDEPDNKATAAILNGTFALLGLSIAGAAVLQGGQATATAAVATSISLLSLAISKNIDPQQG